MRTQHSLIFILTFGFSFALQSFAQTKSDQVSSEKSTQRQGSSEGPASSIKSKKKVLSPQSLANKPAEEAWQYKNRILVKSGAQAISWRDVQIREVFDRWQSLRSSSSPISGTQIKAVMENSGVPLDMNPNIEKLLNQMVVESVISQDSENFKVAEVSEDEAKKTANLFVSDLGAWPQWKQLGVQSSEVEILLVRRLRTQQYLKLFASNDQVLVGESDAHGYFNRNQSRFAGGKFEDFKDGILEVLRRQAQEDVLKDRIEALRRKFKVRFLDQQGGEIASPKNTAP